MNLATTLRVLDTHTEDDIKMNREDPVICLEARSLSLFTATYNS